MKRSLLGRIFGFARETRGTNMVEAAIITPLLLLLTFGLVEFSSLLYVYLSLQNGVSQATRFAVTGNVVAGLDREGSVRQKMREATPTITLTDSAFSFSHMPSGGGGWAGGIGGPGDVGKVTIDYTWTFFTPLMRPFFANNRIAMRVESSMKNENLFQ